jgi:hypothetical protein
MNIGIFTIILVSAFILIFGSKYLPAPRWIVFSAGSMILLLGVLSISQGINLDSTIIKSSFTQNIGVMLSLFGFGVNVHSVF